MATSITPAQASGLFKQVYGDRFLKAAPVEKQLQEDFVFEAGDEPGEAFVESIRMTEEQGFTFRRGGTAADTMRPPVALKTEKASILGDILEFRSRIDFQTMQRAMNSKQAFKTHVGFRMEAMRDSVVKHQEWSLLQGGRAVAAIASISGSGVTRTVTLTAGSFAAGFLASSENMPLDIYDSTSATTTTAVKRNSSAATAKYSVAAYDLDAGTLTLTADDANDWTGVVAGDLIWRATSYTNESPGLLGLTANQTATVNGISAATYAAWRGIVDSTGGTLSMARVLRLAAKQAARNGSKSKLTLRVSPLQFSVLNADLSAARRYDGSYNRTKGTNGYGAIEYFSPNGIIEVKTHLFMKDSEAHLSDDSHVARRGVHDITFEQPNGGEYFLVVPDINAFEYRGAVQNALLNVRPASSALLTGLTVPAL